MSRANNDAVKEEIEEVKKRLEEVASEVRELRSKIEENKKAVQDSASVATTQAEKEEVDARSVFVANVDFDCTPEEVVLHFHTCGTINQTTILTDEFGRPKGCAYVEFTDVEAVENALQLNKSELRGRQLKVSPKRTNIPGMSQYNPGSFDPSMGSDFYEPFAPLHYPAHGYGKAPRFRRPTRYMPY